MIPPIAHCGQMKEEGGKRGGGESKRQVLLASPLSKFVPFPSIANWCFSILFSDISSSVSLSPSRQGRKTLRANPA